MKIRKGRAGFCSRGLNVPASMPVFVSIASKGVGDVRP